ncbi:hypothetical protein E2C01_022370 [Portunus trituberculatus]|uniref:Uncharacterized protein n=1 Tax=Portunus trituberculatus TaxID=210409 RepID=A0A5B7E566_PORTR|nr:hypothetical protein [Portunus trituberculatus]
MFLWLPESPVGPLFPPIHSHPSPTAVGEWRAALVTVTDGDVATTCIAWPVSAPLYILHLEHAGTGTARMSLPAYRDNLVCNNIHAETGTLVVLSSHIRLSLPPHSLVSSSLPLPPPPLPAQKRLS